MRIWDIFPEIAKKVRKSHEEAGLFGHHDWVHAYRVGEVACLVAFDEWGDDCLSQYAGIAGLLHNADRILQKRYGQHNVTQSSLKELIASWLSYANLNALAPSIILDAVLRHDTKNTPDDSKVLIALMDADRIVNLDVDLFCRSGQYYNNLPVVDCKHFIDDPEASYRSPKSVLKDIAYTLDWINPLTPFCMRTRLGKKMAEDRAIRIRDFICILTVQLAEEGIYPYSLEDDSE